MKTCSVPNCNNPVFAKNYCAYHQYLRTDTPRRKLLKRASIPIRSEKRAREEEEYRRVCDKIDQELKDKGEWRCFFTNQKLPEKASHHHLKGRDGDLLMDKRWIVPCLDEPHLDYHDLSVEKLSKKGWHPGFLERLKNRLPELYFKEKRKQEK